MKAIEKESAFQDTHIFLLKPNIQSQCNHTLAVVQYMYSHSGPGEDWRKPICANGPFNHSLTSRPSDWVKCLAQEPKDWLRWSGIWTTNP